jgi:hypothetical protein
VTQTRQRPRRPKAETPDTETTETETTETEPEQETEEQEAEEDHGSAEAQVRKLDNARRKYRRDVEGIIGPIDGASDCPYCDGFGMVPDEAAFLKRDDVEACATCKGLGQMFTGSTVPSHKLLPCPTCAGTGYRPKRPENVHDLPVAPPPIVETQQQVHGWFDPVTQTFHPYGEAPAAQ